jgi:hypothetical protein
VRVPPADAAERKKLPESLRGFLPLDPPGDQPTGKPHPFALRPVQVSTTNGPQHPQGLVLLAGVIVSNRCMNWPEGDPRRVRTGADPAFEESACWVLVTHVFPHWPRVSRSMTYKALGPPSTSKRKRPRDADYPDDGRPVIMVENGVNEYEDVFMWEAWMMRQPGERKLSGFGFSDIKQTNKELVRAIVPWPLATVGAHLRSMRAEDPTLHSFLLDMPLHASLQGRVLDNPEARQPGGLDLRRFLLIELLLRGSPLEGLLDPEPSVRLPQIGPVVTGGGGGLYRRMKAYCDAAYGPPPEGAGVSVVPPNVLMPVV